MVAAPRGWYVLRDLGEQGMQQRLGRGEIEKVFPLNYQLSIVCAAGGTTLFDLQQEEALWQIDCPTECATLSSQGVYLAIAWQGAIYVWSLVTGSLVQKLGGSEKTISDLAFAPTQDRIASASEDGAIAIWDLISGRCIERLKGHYRSVTSPSSLEVTIEPSDSGIFVRVNCGKRGSDILTRSIV